jgi:thiol-disulfide isomerase/thioredoxin
MLKVIAFIVLLSTVSAGQTMVVRGRIVGRNGAPLSGSFVRTDNSGRIDSSAAIADADGRFTILLPGGEPKNLFVVGPGARYSGIIPLLTDPGDSATLDISLDSVKQLAFHFSDPGSQRARFARLHLELSQQYMDFVLALQKLERDDRDSRSYVSAWMDSAAKLEHMVVTEKDPVIRGEFLLRYYRLTSIHGMTFDTLFYRKYVNSIPATSPLWFFNNYEAFDQSSLRTGDRTFLDSILEFHPSRELRAFLLFNAAVEAQREMDEKELHRNYVRLKEEFGDIWWSQIADQWIMVDMKIKRGVQIPDFSFKDVDDSTIVYSKSTLKGNTYLLDFWATWCLPCRAEIPYLQKAYAKYHPKGLQIISISSDVNQSDLSAFREHNATMPWKHVWISRSELKKVHDQFEVTGIPKPILVNREGEIVGLKAELRQENLDKVLEGLFGN